ncbi:DUF4870 domain-containing protein [Candidatus Micrarchaeota archaeon]|nr:DUF4870 domain-containing protein [Candidatus Micrarchaeota archaeon]
MAEAGIGEQINKGADDLAAKARDLVAEKTVSEESRLWAALGYLIVIIFPLIVLLTDKKKDGFLAFHSYQSLILCAAAIVLNVLIGVADFIVGLVMPKVISWLFAMLMMLLWLCVLVLFLVMAYQAYSRRRFMLPVIGAMAEKASR